MTMLICPSCRSFDMLGRLSAVVGAQVTLTQTTGTVTGGFGSYGLGAGPGGILGGVTAFVNLSSCTASDTAQRLYPPAPPRRRPALDIGCIALLASSLIPMAVVPLLLGPFGALFVYPILITLLVFVVKLVRKRRREDDQQVAAEYPLWVRKAALWSLAFYCSRCDIVMIPAGMVDGALANGIWFHADHLYAALSNAARQIDDNALIQLAGRRR